MKAYGIMDIKLHEFLNSLLDGGEWLVSRCSRNRTHVYRSSQESTFTAMNLNTSSDFVKVNPLNAELNPICHLLALLGGATIVVVSRLRVNGERGFSFYNTVTVS